jgi:hypothetical protein
MPMHQVFFQHNVDRTFFHDLNNCEALILLQSPFATSVDRDGCSHAAVGAPAPQ